MIVCVACQGTGKRSKGGECGPCRGTGKGPWISPTKGLAGACELRILLDRHFKERNAESEKRLELGRKVHKHIEEAIDGVPIPSETPEGQIAMQALPTLERLKAKGNLHREHRLLVDCGDYGIDARADVLSFEDASAEAPIEVTDWKSSSNPKKYALKEIELKNDLQALSIAFGLVVQGWPKVALTWVYLPTKDGRAPHVTKATLTAQEVIAQLPALDSKIRRRLYVLKDPAPAVEAHFSECFKYQTACDHIRYCPAKQSLTGAIRRDGVMTMTINQSVLDTIKAMTQSAPAAAQPPAQAPMDLQALLGRAGVQPQAPAAQAPATGAMDLQALMAAMQQAQAPAPPQAAPPQAGPPTTQGAVDLQALIAQAKGAQAPAPQAQAPAMDLQALIAAQAAQAQAAQAAPQAASTPAAAPGVAHRIGVLYVNCMPLDGSAAWVDGATILKEVNALIQRDAGIPHYALAEYGKGAGLIAVAVPHAFDALKTAHVVMHEVVCMALPQPFIDALRPYAQRVVIGMR